MSKLKIVTGSQMCKILEYLGFTLLRQKGSHRFYRHSDGRTTVVPMHTGDLDRSLIRKIMRDVELSIDEFNELA